MLEAKRRAGLLQKEAATLPADSRRRRVLLAVAAPVSGRTLAAAMVPIGILLGPLVMPFVWFRERIDPAVALAPPGAQVTVVALVDADFADPVEIHLPPDMKLDMASRPAKSLPPIRLALDHMVALYSRPEIARDAWERELAPKDADAARDLQAYLKRGIPPQGMSWTIIAPENAEGVFEVSVTAKGHAPAAVHYVLGERNAPVPPREDFSEGSPIRRLSVVYPPSATKPYFWHPLGFLVSEVSATATAPAEESAMQHYLAGFDVGWIWVYIVAYLPVLFLARFLMKVA